MLGYVRRVAVAALMTILLCMCRNTVTAFQPRLQRAARTTVVQSQRGRHHAHDDRFAAMESNIAAVNISVAVTETNVAALKTMLENMETKNEKNHEEVMRRTGAIEKTLLDLTVTVATVGTFWTILAIMSALGRPLPSNFVLGVVATIDMAQVRFTRITKKNKEV
jgi:hypothetical protein